jgi:hypothetical protein
VKSSGHTRSMQSALPVTQNPALIDTEVMAPLCSL